MEKIKILLLALLFFTSCAKIVAPVGGPKDTTPPVVIKESPLKGSVNFNEKSIKITFNEFVTLNNPIENIIFSPPLQNSADYSIKGKSIVIKWKEELLKNTTYSIVFADAVKDYTEGNLLNLYQYSFSTGSQIDTVQLSGFIKNAETGLPEKGVFVFLYQQNADTLPYSSRPTYLTKSNNEGVFQFHNIKQESYKIFALRDINSNLIFDLQNEGIAFQEAQITPDTNQRILLSYFIEKDTIQSLLNPLNYQKGIYTIPMKLSCKSEKSVKSTILYPQNINYHIQFNKNLDTLTYFFLEDFSDSVVLEIKLLDWNKIDTLTFYPYKPPYRPGRAKLDLKLGILSSHLGDPYNPLTLNFSFPIKPTQNIETIIIKKGKETNDTLIERFQVSGDFIKTFVVPYPFESKESYTVLFKDSLFYGWDGTTNDSIQISFTVKNDRDYGSLMMTYNVPDEDSNYILELIDGNQKVVQKNMISKREQIEYPHLEPGNYKIRVIVDQNGNGKWDTGNYMKNIQPERILFFEKPISIRGFWDLEETFDIK